MVCFQEPWPGWVKVGSSQANIGELPLFPLLLLLPCSSSSLAPPPPPLLLSLLLSLLLFS